MTDKPRTEAGEKFLEAFLDAEEAEDDALMKFDEEHEDIEHDLGFPMGCGTVKAAVLAIEAEAAEPAHGLAIEVANSGVEFQMLDRYVVVQIATRTWSELQQYAQQHRSDA